MSDAMEIFCDVCVLYSRWINLGKKKKVTEFSLHSIDDVFILWKKVSLKGLQPWSFMNLVLLDLGHTLKSCKRCSVAPALRS